MCEYQQTQTAKASALCLISSILTNVFNIHFPPW